MFSICDLLLKMHRGRLIPRAVHFRGAVDTNNARLYLGRLSRTRTPPIGTQRASRSVSSTGSPRTGYLACIVRVFNAGRIADFKGRQQCYSRYSDLIRNIFLIISYLILIFLEKLWWTLYWKIRADSSEKHISNAQF